MTVATNSSSELNQVISASVLSRMSKQQGLKQGLERNMVIKQRREELGMSQAELARRVSISQPSLHNIEIGKTRHSRYLPDIYSQLGLDVQTGAKVQGGGSPLSGNNPQGQRMPIYQMRPNAEGEMSLSKNVVEYEVKPSLLAHVANAFGILVWGNENSPAYNPGDVVFIHPDRPPVIGRDVVVRKATGSDEEQSGVFIGQLVSETDKQFVIKQYNGNTRKFDKAGWTLDHIVGSYNAR